MPALLLLATTGACVAVWRGTLERALWVLVLTIVLVPGSLQLPVLPGVLTVHRVLLLVLLVSLVRRTRRGELPRAVWAVPSVVRRLALFVGVAAVLGVGLVQPSVDPGAAARNWEALVAQLLFLVVFVVLLRAVDDPLLALKALALAAIVAALIAVLERLTGASYARAWFRATPDLLGTDQAQRLAERGGKVRVRAAADFTLAYAWTAAATVPVLMVLAALQRRLRPALLLGVPLVLATVVLTYSRSVIAPVVATMLLVAAVLRHRSLRVMTAAVCVLGGYVVLASPGLEHQFTAAVDQGSIDVRVDRLPVVAGLVADHAYHGLGISGLASQGIAATDSSYLLTYAELGVIGLALFTALLVSSVATSLAHTRSRVYEERLVALGAGLGALLLLVGTFSFDAFSAPAAAETFWLLVALGVVVGDGLPPWRLRLPAAARGGLVLAALLVGLVLRWTAPTHVAQTWQFESITPYPATVQAATFTGTQLRTTACRQVAVALPDTEQTCAPGIGPGQGILRLAAGSKAQLDADVARALDAVHGVRQLSRVTLMSRGDARTGTPTPLRTAWVSLPVLVGFLVLPLRRR